MASFSEILNCVKVLTMLASKSLTVTTTTSPAPLQCIEYRLAVTKKPLVGMNRHLMLPEIKASYVLLPLTTLPQYMKIGALFFKGAFHALS
jgi:hypothetical protein